MRQIGCLIWHEVVFEISQKCPRKKLQNIGPCKVHDRVCCNINRSLLPALICAPFNIE